MNSRLRLPKLGWLRYRNSRKVLGAVKNVTVTLSCGKWFASIQTEREVELPLPRGGAVGIDLGVVRFATLSDGTVYAPLNSFKRHATTLRKAQLAMCRKQKFSRNWNKAKSRIQRIHARIGNARRDYLHKTSTAISQKHAMACIEDLPQCDHVSAQNRQTQERFACVGCSFEDNADRVGAINILRAGHARCACEVSDALRSPAAGTRRSGSGGAQCNS